MDTLTAIFDACVFNWHRYATFFANFFIRDRPVRPTLIFHYSLRPRKYIGVTSSHSTVIRLGRIQKGTS